MLAVTASVKLVKDAVGERLEALAAGEARPVEQLAVGVDDPFVRVEALFAAGAGHVLNVHAQAVIPKSQTRTTKI